jgi:hypothetical protein
LSRRAASSCTVVVVADFLTPFDAVEISAPPVNGYSAGIKSPTADKVFQEDQPLMTVLSIPTRHTLDQVVFTDGSWARTDLITPVVLAIPTEMAIEFDISWMADEPSSDIVGDGCK